MVYAFPDLLVFAPLALVPAPILPAVHALAVFLVLFEEAGVAFTVAEPEDTGSVAQVIFKVTCIKVTISLYIRGFAVYLRVGDVSEEHPTVFADLNNSAFPDAEFWAKIPLNESTIFLDPVFK